jgi:hypothetical protein
VPERQAPGDAHVFAGSVQGLPSSAPLRQMSLLNAPRCDMACPGQNMPVAELVLTLSVVSGFMLIAMSPTKSEQAPPRQSAPTVHVCSLLGPR